MGCPDKQALEQHQLDIRTLSHPSSSRDEKEKAAARAERFAIQLIKEHESAGHDGEACPDSGL
jgi:hypothetical protein